MGLLDDKVVVITGAGNGIGRATALAAAKEGARLVLNDLGCAPDGTGEDPALIEALGEELRQAGSQVLTSAASMAERDAAEALALSACERFGRVDALIHCAGIARDGSLLRVRAEDFEQLLRVQLGATLWCTQSIGAVMKKQGSGSIVMTTSSAGLIGNFGQSAYAAANAGVYGLMRTACVELQRYSIRVNAVAPLAKTRLTQALPLFEQVDSMTPEHVAPAYLFLASDLSRDVTGHVLSAAGGRLSAYRMTETAGVFKDSEGGIWTPTEIAEHFSGIRR